MVKEMKKVYRNIGRHRAKREVAKEDAHIELCVRLDTKEGENSLLARERDQNGKNVQQVRMIRDRDKNLLTS